MSIDEIVTLFFLKLNTIELNYSQQELIDFGLRRKIAVKAGKIHTARNFLDGGEMLKCEHTAEYARIAHNAARRHAPQRIT